MLGEVDKHWDGTIQHEIQLHDACGDNHNGMLRVWEEHFPGFQRRVGCIGPHPLHLWMSSKPRFQVSTILASLLLAWSYLFEICLCLSGYLLLLSIGHILQSQLQCILNWPVLWVHIYEVKLLHCLWYIIVRSNIYSTKCKLTSWTNFLRSAGFCLL